MTNGTQLCLYDTVHTHNSKRDKPIIVYKVGVKGANAILICAEDVETSSGKVSNYVEYTRKARIVRIDEVKANQIAIVH